MKRLLAGALALSAFSALHTRSNLITKREIMMELPKPLFYHEKIDLSKLEPIIMETPTVKEEEINSTVTPVEETEKVEIPEQTNVVEDPGIPTDLVVYPESPSQFYVPDPNEALSPRNGVFNGPSGTERYYNLDMSGVISIAKNQGIEGEYWVREDGVKMYGSYVICACGFDVRPRGTIVETSLGPGICLDTGGFAASDPYMIDIATTW